MSGNVVDRQPHSCGSRRGLNIFSNDDGTYSGFCFASATICSLVMSVPFQIQS